MRIKGRKNNYSCFLYQYSSIITKFQKIKKLSDNTSNQPPKFRTKNGIEINDVGRGTYNTNSQTKGQFNVTHIYNCELNCNSRSISSRQ